MKRFVIYSIIFVFSISAFAAQQSYKQAAKLSINSMKADKSSAGTYERITIDIDLDATFDNPFDPDDIRVDMQIMDSEGKFYLVPAFYYQPYEKDLSGASSRRTKSAGIPSWKGRISFDKAGIYKVCVIAKDRNYLTKNTPIQVKILPGDSKGMIRLDENNDNYFKTDRGNTFFPVGANVCWATGPERIFTYDQWFPRYSQAGCNFARLWLSLEWNDLALVTQRSGYDQVDLQRAWNVDHVLELAEQYGIHLMLCFDAHGMVRSKKTQHGFWEMSAYHPDYGAPITAPEQFFTNPDMQRAYRNRLRYIVARYGCSPNVFAWEFFNEVDIIDNYDDRAVTKWHKDMARYLRSIDPWKHLITTSFANPAGKDSINCLEEIDFVQTHHYQAPDIAAAMQQDIDNKKAAKTKPHFHGEFGINHSGRETTKLDPKGIHIHNGLFASPGQMHAGTPMSWWWDSYIHPQDLYHIYAAFNRWIDGFDFIAQSPSKLQAEFQWQDSAKAMVLDFVLQPRGKSWKKETYLVPTRVKVNRDGTIESNVYPAAVLHGLKNHPDLHNPVEFDLDVGIPGKFSVDVFGTSGHGGSAISISLDGKEMLRRDFIDKDNPNRGGELIQFNGQYSIDLPAGKHTVKVDSVGKDWFFVDSYRISNYVKSTNPPLRAYGLIGKSMGLLWVQNPQYTWSNVSKPDFNIRTISGSKLLLDGFEAEKWKVQQIDTGTGYVTSENLLEVKPGGRAIIDLPDIEWNTAYKFEKQ